MNISSCTKKSVFLLVVLWTFFNLRTMAQVENIIPTPKEYTITNQSLHSLRSMEIDKKFVQTKGKDEYILRIKGGKVVIGGNTLWAKQTLLQLEDEQGRVPDIAIHDWSAFPWRGFMHDTGRNFQSIEMLKETIDLMARYKLNLFHWHLTDNPAWRIECHCYPQLNDPQFQTKGRDEGKFYTYNEIRELISYALGKGITVMPEIDMPGHSAFFKKAFGFTMDSGEGKKVLKDCIDEFFGEIPASLCPYFHVGSDEINIADPSGFANWIQNYVREKGRTPVAWSPGLPTLPFTVRQLWNGAGANNSDMAKDEGKYFDSFVGYLNYYDPIMFTMRAFQHNAPLPLAYSQGGGTEYSNKELGGILCLWNDVRVDNKRNISLHNGMIPGMMTFAERFWQGGANGEVIDEDLYPDPATPQGKALAEMERRMMAHKERYYTDDQIRWYPNASLAWNIKIGDKEMKAWGGAVSLDALCKVNGLVANDQNEATAETTLYAENDTIIKAWLGFDTPARSDRMSTGIGKQGRWENNGHCYLNGEEILPQKPWKEPGKYNYPFHTWHKAQAEEPFSDEQFYWMRKPVALHLRKGENKIRIVNPHSFKGQRWGYSFIPLQ